MDGLDGLQGPKPSGQLFLSAAGMWPRTTTGASANTKVETATNKINVYTIDFDPTTQEYAQGDLVMPSDWDGGGVFATFYWMATGTSTNGVVWSCAGRSYGDLETLDQALGTAVQAASDAHSATASQVQISAETAAITLTGAAAGELVVFEVSRVTGDAGDTLAVDAQLLGVMIRFTRKNV
jgi:hypothetical protein